jgi:hypothetical protein
MTQATKPTNTREVMLAALAAGRTVQEGMDECVAFLEQQERQRLAERQAHNRANAPLRGNTLRYKR